jgi:AraC family transcriptional regulator, glycine betaine-responsive activator
MSFHGKTLPLAHEVVVPASDSAGREVVFLLLEGFTHLAFACAIEPLRLANLATGRTLYRWRTASLDGRPVACSNGTRLLPDGSAEPVGRGARLVVVGGGLRHRRDIRLTSFVRNCQVHGAEVLGLCGGVAVLAQAGLLANQDCAVHWQVRDAFREHFPEVRVSANAFVDGQVPTAAGGTAAADLMLHLIKADQDDALAVEVADLMVYNGVRGPDAPQTTSVQARLGIRNHHLLQAIQLMEENVETPLAMPELAQRIGLSVRQVERLFVRHLQTSPNRYYVVVRLERARRLLVQSDLSVVEVALACGFESPTHFGKRYRQQFGIPAFRTRTTAG